MISSTQTTALTTQKKFLFSLFYFMMIIFIFLSGAEIVLRFRGIQPWRVTPVRLHKDPPGPFFRTDSLLGYTHIPGKYTFTKGMDFTYRVTQVTNTLRATRPIQTGDSTRSGEEIWFFGGSFTYGWTLNDEETFAWRVHQAMPEYEVLNFGCNGYGTIQALVQIEHEIRMKLPKAIVIMYAGFHDERNTFLRAKRKSMAPWNHLGNFRQPYARLDSGHCLQINYAEVTYTPFPLQKISALAHFIELRYNAWEHEHHRSHEVSRAIIRKIRDIAEPRGVRLIVAGITDSDKTREMLRYCASGGIETVDVSVDLSIPENNNLPHDGHPSATANQRYADRLLAFFQEKS